ETSRAGCTMSGSSGGALTAESSRCRVSHPGIGVSDGERPTESGCGPPEVVVAWSHHAERVRTYRAPRRVLTDGTDSPRCSALRPRSCPSSSTQQYDEPLRGGSAQDSSRAIRIPTPDSSAVRPTTGCVGSASRRLVEAIHHVSEDRSRTVY